MTWRFLSDLSERALLRGKTRYRRSSGLSSTEPPSPDGNAENSCALFLDLPFLGTQRRCRTTASRRMDGSGESLQASGEPVDNGPAAARNAPNDTWTACPSGHPTLMQIGRGRGVREQTSSFSKERHHPQAFGLGWCRTPEMIRMLFARGRTEFDPVRSVSQHCSNATNDN